MEKELFISTLKEKSQVDNLSERTIDEVATLFLPQFADDEKITDDSWNIPVQMVKTMSGQLRHDLSGGITAFKAKFETENKAQIEKDKQAAIDAFKAEWEKNHPTNEHQLQEPDIDKKIADAISKSMAGLTGEDGVLGKLNKQFSDYLKQQEEREKAATEADVRSQVREYLIDKGVEEDDFALEYTLEKLVIGEKPDVNALKTKAEKDYEANYKKIHKKDEGALPFKGGGGTGNDSNTEFQRYIDAKKAEAEQEARDAESLRKDMM